MKTIHSLDSIAISVLSRKILKKILSENPILETILRFSSSETEALNGIRNWILPMLKKNNAVHEFLENKSNTQASSQLRWEDLAAIRLMDYIDHAGEEYPDQNIGGEMAVSNPIKMLWLAVNFGTGGAKPAFFNDMLKLFRQLNGNLSSKLPSLYKVRSWMKRYPSGLDSRVVKLRETNRDRILKVLMDKIEKGEIKSQKYFFEEGLQEEQKWEKINNWWLESAFHLRFAVRSPEMLNELLGNSLDPDTMNILFDAKQKGIPFFVNPYYLSLLNVETPDFIVGADLAIRCYILYSKQLVKEFGKIVAWEKEDKVKAGEPNAAGWILPSHNIHRRYPEVAIFIPDTVGRACAGLCASCQRMYDFQSGRYNFDLEKLKPTESWSTRLPKLLNYFKDDSKLCDILITGGDALMSTDKNLKQILNGIYEMAKLKKEENQKREDSRKFAEMVRVRIGTRLPVYLPQRITPELCEILREFKEKASKAGIQQFIIQTHFESPLEVTPESERGIKLLLKAGWAVTNQLVLTAEASRRGHTAKLRQVLNKIGVLTYYTLTVKGYQENNANFAPNARAVQEQIEEKIYGIIPNGDNKSLKTLLNDAPAIRKNISSIKQKHKLPFLATDRNILNLPGVGKSLTFRTIGITRYGRRILEFDHDQTRNHSPIIHKMGKVVIIESKSIDEYLHQLYEMGEEIKEYESIYGYSIGQTEPRMKMYEYPEYDFKVTSEFTNLEI